MSKQLSRIAPWQAGKLFAVLYFFLSLIFVVPMILVTAIVPMPMGPGIHFSMGPFVLPIHVRTGGANFCTGGLLVL